jgi:hypothetical protein
LISGARRAGRRKNHRRRSRPSHLSLQQLPTDVVVNSPRYDKTFKILLGEEGGENRTISFLNAVLGLKTETEQIQSVRLLKDTLPSADVREIQFDVRIEATCETYKGDRFIVEMQLAKTAGHIGRWIYYGARDLSASITNTLKRRSKQVGDSETLGPCNVTNITFYERLKPVRVIVIMGFEPAGNFGDKDEDEWIMDAGLFFRRTGKELSDLLSFTFVILPRFSEALEKLRNLNQKKPGSTKEPPGFDNGNLVGWLKLLTRKHKEPVHVTLDLVAGDEALADAYYRLGHLSAKEQDSLLTERNIRQARNDWAILLVKNSTDAGIKIGEERGEERGIKIGEKRAKEDVAKRMFMKGKSREEVMEDTELSEGTIDALQKETTMIT